MSQINQPIDFERQSLRNEKTLLIGGKVSVGEPGAGVPGGNHKYSAPAQWIVPIAPQISLVFPPKRLIPCMKKETHVLT